MTNADDVKRLPFELPELMPFELPEPGCVPDVTTQGGLG
jgi:hypothetical protein